MPFIKGQSGNPSGLSKGDRDAIRKIRMSIDRAIDNMKAGKKVGMVALAERITSALESDTIGTLKALSTLLPKDVTVESYSNTNPDELSNEQLAEIVAKRARKQREENEQQLAKIESK